MIFPTCKKCMINYKLLQIPCQTPFSKKRHYSSVFFFSSSYLRFFFFVFASSITFFASSRFAVFRDREFFARLSALRRFAIYVYDYSIVLILP